MNLILNDENSIDPVKQAIKIHITVGTEGLQRLNASTLADEDKRDPANLYKLFDDHLDIKVNSRIHRMELMTFRQNEHEQLMNSSTGRATSAVYATSANLTR